MRSTPDLTARPGRRPGFTLIELLVVVALIGVLASLAISGVVKLRAAQMKTFTENTINKLASAFDQQWKASLDDIKQEEPDLTRSSGIAKLANYDPRRARVIYNKMRLKSRFPVTFAEALSPDPLKQLVPPEAQFVRDLNGVNAATVPPDMQSSVLLFLSLTQARRGMQAFKPDEMDPTSIGTVNIPFTNGQTKVMSYFKDAWERPIRLYTYPTGNDELQQAPYVNPSSPPLAHDPLDPEGTLYDVAWLTSPASTRFAGQVHALRAPNIASVLGAQYLTPVIASAGPDGDFGVDPVTMAPVNPDTAGDNIYSYRLRRSGARGD
jgi:prepilin-type N-terminal cleavage/methylation domain-containing protein